MLLCGRIFLVARFLLVSFPRILAHKDCAQEVHTLDNPSRWTLSFPDFHVVLGALGESDGAI